MLDPLARQESVRFLSTLCMRASEITCHAVAWDPSGQVVLRRWVGDSGATVQSPRVPVNFVVVGTSAAIGFLLLLSSDGCLLGVELVARFCGEKS